MNFEKLTNSFWKLQIGGWLIYMFFIYITFLSVARPENFIPLMYIKGIRTVIGFCFNYDSVADLSPNG